MKDEWPPPYEYLGRPTAWLRIVRDFGEPVPHKHHCPACYERWACTDSCTLEPDLEDRGDAFGSHCECEPCRERARRAEETEARWQTMRVARRAHLAASMLILSHKRPV